MPTAACEASHEQKVPAPHSRAVTKPNPTPLTSTVRRAARGKKQGAVKKVLAGGKQQQQQRRQQEQRRRRFEVTPFATAPAACPSGVADARAELENLTASEPGASAALFLRCLLARGRSRPLGNRICAQVLHPRCLANLDESGGRVSTVSTAISAAAVAPRSGAVIRKHTIKQLQAISAAPHAIRAMASGARPENGYDYDGPAVLFNVTEITGCGEQSDDTPFEEGSACQVHFEVAGTLPGHPTTRWVGMELHGGRWYARDLSRLALPVLPPVAGEDEDEDDGSAGGSADAPAEYQIVRRTESEYLSSGPVDLHQTVRRRAKQTTRGTRERAAEASARHTRAEASTSGLARALSAVEINRKFAAEPAPRKVVHIQDGMITCRHLKPGELYDPAVGLEYRVVTVEDELAAAAAAKADAERATLLRLQQRVAAAVGATATTSG